MSLRLIAVADGFSSSAVPSDLQMKSGGFIEYLSQEDFVTAKGSPAASGDTFFNSTTNQVETYLNGSWVPLENELVKTLNELEDGNHIAIHPGKRNQTFLIEGKAGHVELSETPFGVIEPLDGTLITVTGTSDAKTVKLVFSAVDYGLYMNMPSRILDEGKTIQFKFNKLKKRFEDTGANF